MFNVKSVCDPNQKWSKCVNSQWKDVCVCGLGAMMIAATISFFLQLQFPIWMKERYVKTFSFDVTALSKIPL